MKVLLNYTEQREVFQLILQNYVLIMHNYILAKYEDNEFGLKEESL